MLLFSNFFFNLLHLLLLILLNFGLCLSLQVPSGVKFGQSWSTIIANVSKSSPWHKEKSALYKKVYICLMFLLSQYCRHHHMPCDGCYGKQIIILIRFRILYKR